MDHHLLSGVLSKLRQRMIWIGGLAGIGWGLAVGLFCLMLGAWMDLLLEFSPALRIGTLIFVLLAVVVPAVTVLLRAARDSSWGFLANRLDTVAGTGGQIHSGLALCQMNRQYSSSRNPDLTSQLAEIAVNRAAELAVHADRSQAVPIDPLRRSLRTFIGLSALLLVFSIFLPRVAATEWNRFLNPYGDHPPFSQVIFRVEPEGARVVYGEGLDIRVTVEGAPAEDLELVLDPLGQTENFSDLPEVSPSDVLPMFPERGHRWRATISDIRTPLTYHVRTRNARSHRYSIEVITVPEITDVRFRIIAPEYTRRPVYDGPVPHGGLSGLSGTRVEITARSNRPLSGGRLTFPGQGKQQESEFIPAAEGSNEVTGKFTIQEPGRIVLTVVDVDGQESGNSFTAPVTLLVDERPFVRLLQPKAISFATPTALIPVVISAEDDYGISRLQLFRNLNDSRYLPSEIPVPPPPPTRAHEIVSLPLAEYGLEPGDEIKLFARVEDNDPITGLRDVSDPSRVIGKGTESSLVVIRIISQEEFDRMQRVRNGLQMLMSKYQQARRRMESLAEEIKNLREKIGEEPGGSKLNKEYQEELKKLVQRLKEEGEALRKLAENRLPYELDKELSPRLNAQAEVLKKLAEQIQELAGDKKTTNEQASRRLKEMLDFMNGNRKLLDSEISQPLEMLARIMPLMQDQARFVQLYQKQRDLAQRLESVEGQDGKDDPLLKTRMRDLETEQNMIRQGLIQLLDDIRDHVEMLPEDPLFDGLRSSALEFANAVRESGATAAMTEAVQSLAEFSGTRGHAGAVEAADILEKFLSKCNGMGEAGQNLCRNCLPRFQPSLGNCLNKTMQQLLAEAGLRPGTGMGNGIGQGAGGGYSARRSTMQNVGLYGNSPFLDQASAQSGNSSDQTQNASGRSGNLQNRSDRETSSFSTSGTLKASGVGEVVVPLKYRRKVGRYFQRIADELGDQ